MEIGADEEATKAKEDGTSQGATEAGQIEGKSMWSKKRDQATTQRMSTARETMSTREMVEIKGIIIVVGTI